MNVTVRMLMFIGSGCFEACFMSFQVLCKFYEQLIFPVMDRSVTNVSLVNETDELINGKW